MNRTLLIVVGIACALVTAAGIMRYNNPVYTKIKGVSTVSNELIRSGKTISEIRELLNDEDPYIVGQAIEIIATLKDKKSMPKIRELIKLDKMRWFAIWALAKLDDKESIPEFTKLLHDSDSSVRAMTIVALGKSGIKELIPEFTKLLYDHEPLIRSSAVEELRRLNAKESIPEIKKSLNDESEYVRQVAETALKHLGVPEDEIQKAKEGK